MVTRAPSTAEISARVEGLTVASRFVQTARARAGEVALRWKEGDDWKEWTWSDRP